MRPLFVVAALAALLLLGACATQGAGARTNPAAIAQPCAGQDAAAAAAAGGQQAHQAPFSEDTARLAPQTTWAGGSGAASTTSADNETRHVVSGGAQNCGVILPTDANASTGGGSNPAVMEAAKTVSAYRSMLQVALMDPSTMPERIDLLSAKLAEAQESLAVAQAASTVTHVTNHNFQGSRINQIPFSSSSSDGRPSPEAVGPVAEAARVVGTAVFSDEMLESAPAAPDFPLSEPVGSPDGESVP